MLKITKTLFAFALAVSAGKALYGQQPVLFHSGPEKLPADLHEVLLNSWDKENIFDHRVIRLVQTHTPLPDAGRLSLEASGVQILSYIPHAAYLLSIPEHILPQDVHFPAGSVHTIASLPAQAKLHPALHGGNYPPYAAVVAGKVDVMVQHASGKEVASAFLGSAGFTVVETPADRAMIRIRLEAGMHNLNRLAEQPAVLWIEPLPDPGEAEDERGRTMHRANLLDADYGGGRQYTGNGIKGCINDDGFVGPHIDFTGRLDQALVSGTMTGTHGDMTCGIFTGAGNLDPLMRGMAYGALVWITDYDASMPNTVPLHTGNGVLVYSTSYSNGCNAGYTTVAQQIDQETNSYPTILQFFSAGNSGSSDCGYGAGAGWGNITGGHKVAKNVIATANLEANDVRVNSSSRGPAADGRLKPDIAANGGTQMSTDENNTYQVGGGTSAASPGAAGVAMQLYDAYNTLFGSLPKAGLIKTVMQNSADDLGNPGPDYSFGWGRVNGGKAVRTLEENRFVTGFISAGGLNNHSINVPSGVSQLKVMLSWRDKEGAVLSAKALVNDLDFTLNDPGAGTNLPLILSSDPSIPALTAPAAPGIDTLNNSEQVVINSPAPGTYIVNIAGTEVPFGPQEYWVAWDFVYDSVKVTYPLGGEGFQGGDVVRIRWDASRIAGTFAVEYSTNNGTSWNMIASSVNDTLRFRDWTVPSLITTGEALVRVTRGAYSSESEANFSVIGIPDNINVDWVCPDSFQVSWDAAAGATDYDVFILGAMYMDSVGSTTGLTKVVAHPAGSETWVSVRSRNGAAVGRRAIAVQKVAGLSGCVLAEDAELSSILSPGSGGLPDCIVSGTSDVTVEITNNGVTLLASPNVSYRHNSGAIITETYPFTLMTGMSGTHTFATPITLTVGTNTVQTWVSMPGDDYTTNDTMMSSFSIYAGTTVSTPIWSENFETMSLCDDASNCEVTVCPLLNGLKNITNGDGDDIDWRVLDGPTPSVGTGPDVDHDPGTASGNYVYLEASNGCNYKEAHLILPCFDLTSALGPEFRFWYHLYGDNIGELHVDVLSEMGGWDLDVVPMISGNYGNVWWERVVNLIPYMGQKVAIRLRGTTADDFEGDMALDDFNLNMDALSAGAPTSGDFAASIFPNPASGSATLRVQTAGKGFEATVMNLLGQPLQQFTSRDNEYVLPLDGLSAGLYFCRIRTAIGEKVISFEVSGN